MRVQWILTAVLAIATQRAWADPWPRAPGETFVAVTATQAQDQTTNGSTSDLGFYAEHGLTKRLTLGVSASDNVVDYSHTFGFARYTFTKPTQTWQVAANLGIGASRRNVSWGGAARLGVAVGRSTNLWSPGWWRVSASLETHELWSKPVYKLDATAGINLAPRWKTFVDLEASQRNGSPDVVTLRTSLAWETGTFGHLIFGLEAKEARTRTLGLRIGVWHTF